MLKLINNNCPELKAMREGPRTESRVNLTVVCLVIPVQKKRPVVERMFAATTMEFTALGVALVLDSPRTLEEGSSGFAGKGGRASSAPGPAPPPMGPASSSGWN